MIYQQTPDFYNEYISHSAVWEGRSRYRNGEDELEHGWAKDAAAKAHKYIDRWRGKNGKWYYQYKSKAQELGTKIRRKLGTPYNSRFSIDPETITTRNSVSGARITFGDDYGRADSHSGKQRLAHLPNDKARERYKAGISAGRKRATKKGYGLSKGKTGTNLTSRGYSGSRGQASNNKATSKAVTGTNLTSRGYSGSRGQASNNKATSKAVSRREHMDYLKKNRSIKGGKAGLVNPNEPKRYTRRTERAHKEALKRDEEFFKYLIEAANHSSSRKKR